MFSTTLAFIYTLLTFSNLATVSAAPISSSHTLVKRQSFNGRATFYDVGLGACGQYNVESDFIVALNTAQYGGGYPGPNCGRSITISYGGKTAQATIMDQCPSCGFGDLDLSRSLFNHFSDPGAGVFQMSWSFNDGNNGGGGGGQEQPKPKTSTKPKYTPPPTSTWTPPPPTSTWTPAAEPTTKWTPASSSTTPTPSTASSSSTSASASDSESGSSTVVSPNATISGSSISTPSPTYAIPAGFGNLALLNQFVTNLGSVIVVGAQSEMNTSIQTNMTIASTTSASLA